MIQILGAADIISALVLVSRCFNSGMKDADIVVFFALYLIIKGAFFINDIGSWLDIGCGSLLIASLFIVIPAPILAGAAAFLGLKGILSLFA